MTEIALQPGRAEADPDGGRDRIADRGAAEAAEEVGLVDRLADERVVGRRRRRDLRLACEQDKPTLRRGGTLSRNVCSARCAATSRVGFTSCACIEPETSSTRTTVALSLATRRCTRGRETATQRVASASRKTPATSQRRHGLPRGDDRRETSTFVYRTAYCIRRRAIARR